LIARDRRRSGVHWSVWRRAYRGLLAAGARTLGAGVFHTLQDRLVKELALKEIDTVEAANLFLCDVYIPEYNARFAVAAAQEARRCGDPWRRPCGDFMRPGGASVGNDNCVSFNRLKLQIKPAARPFRQDARESAPISRWNPCDFLRAAMPWTLR